MGCGSDSFAAHAHAEHVVHESMAKFTLLSHNIDCGQTYLIYQLLSVYFYLNRYLLAAYFCSQSLSCSDRS